MRVDLQQMVLTSSSTSTEAVESFLQTLLNLVPCVMDLSPLLPPEVCWRGKKDKRLM